MLLVVKNSSSVLLALFWARFSSAGGLLCETLAGLLARATFWNTHNLCGLHFSDCVPFNLYVHMRVPVSHVSLIEEDPNPFSNAYILLHLIGKEGDTT
eukprot:scaffold4520_cov14-Tisochrysis_lutea.AAC.1